MIEKVTQLVEQRTNQPTRKQNFNLVGSQLATVMLGLFAMFSPDMYARIPDGFEASFGSLLGGLLGFAFGWFAKENLV